MDTVRRIPFAALGTCAYLLGFIAPFQWDVPLIALGIFAFLSCIFSPTEGSVSRPPLLIPVSLFLAAVGVSILTSINTAWSFYLSVSLLPAILIYFLIAAQFDKIYNIRMLFISFSTVLFVISSFIIILYISNFGKTPMELVSQFTSPLFVVPNDAAFLAIIAPFGLALVVGERDRLIRSMAIASLVSGVVAIYILQSRSGLLTLMVSTTAFIGLFRIRSGLVWLAVISGAVLIIDAMSGFPLLSKLASSLDTRLTLWLAAWAMFLDAPMFGHGPHTFGLLLPHYIGQGPPIPAFLAAVVPSQLPVHRAAWPHDLYLEILAEQGIVGLATLSALLAGAIRLGWNLTRTSQGNMRIYAIAALSALLGFCFAGILETGFIRHWVSVTMFALVALVGCLARLRTMPRDDTTRNSVVPT